MWRLAAVLCVFVSASPLTFGYSSYGLGQIPCSTYLDRRGQDQAQQRMDNTAFVHAYLSGYLTAGNTLHGVVGEHAKDISIDIHRMVQWLDAYCAKHLDDVVAVALESFWVEAAAAQEQLKQRQQNQ